MKQNETELSLKVLQKNGLIIRVNLRGLRDNHKPAELAEIRRQDIYKIQGDNSEKKWEQVHFPTPIINYQCFILNSQAPL